MPERDEQLTLGLNFEAKSALKSASESVSRQYLRDYAAGEVNSEAWQNIANLHSKHAYKIRQFMGGLYGAWAMQQEAESDDPRFLYLQSVKYSQRKVLSNQFMNIGEAINLNLVEDLLWMRSTEFKPSMHSDYLLSEELDEIYGEITPEAILEDELGNVDYPTLAWIPHESLIERILKGEISISPSSEFNQAGGN